MSALDLKQIIKDKANREAWGEWGRDKTESPAPEAYADDRKKQSVWKVLLSALNELRV